MLLQFPPFRLLPFTTTLGYPMTFSTIDLSNWLAEFRIKARATARASGVLPCSFFRVNSRIRFRYFYTRFIRLTIYWLANYALIHSRIFIHSFPMIPRGLAEDCEYRYYSSEGLCYAGRPYSTILRTSPSARPLQLDNRLKKGG